jgi:hypothetical protein
MIKYNEFIDGELARVIVVTKQRFVNQMTIELESPYITFVELDVLNGTLQIIMDSDEDNNVSRSLICESITTEIEDKIINLINKNS